MKFRKTSSLKIQTFRSKLGNNWLETIAQILPYSHPKFYRSFKSYFLIWLTRQTLEQKIRGTWKSYRKMESRYDSFSKAGIIQRSVSKIENVEDSRSPSSAKMYETETMPFYFSKVPMKLSSGPENQKNITKYCIISSKYIKNLLITWSFRNFFSS